MTEQSSKKKKAAFITPLKDFAESTDRVKIALVLKGKGPIDPSPHLTPAKNFRRILHLLGVHPRHYFHPKNFFPQFWKGQTLLREKKVLLKYLNGKGEIVEKVAATNHEGYIEISPDEIPAREIRISLPDESSYFAEEKIATLFHLSQFTGETLYFSDHDDTVKFTGVVTTLSESDDSLGDLKRRISKTNVFQTTLTNPYVWHTFPGSPQLAQAVVNGGKEPVPMIVITGSPKFLSEDINLFYQLKGFPQPSVIHLKDTSEDRKNNLGYKKKIFSRALEVASKNPNLKRVILDGDRGENDPEVANFLAESYPKIEFVVGVHNITSEENGSPRFDSLRSRDNVKLKVYNNKYEFGQFLLRLNLIQESSLDLIRESIEESNQRITTLLREGKLRRKAKKLPSSTISLEELEKYHLFFPDFS